MNERCHAPHPCCCPRCNAEDADKENKRLRAEIERLEKELATAKHERDEFERDRNAWQAQLQRVKPGMWKDGTYGCSP